MVVGVSAPQPSSSGRIGEALTVLIGVAGIALIAAIGTHLGRCPTADPGSRDAPVAAKSAAITDSAARRVAIAAKWLVRLRDAVARRFHPVVAAVLAFAAGIAAALVVTYAFGLVTKAGFVIHLDRPVGHFVDAHRLALVTRLMGTLTLLGSYPVAYATAVAGGLIIGVLSRHWFPLIALVAATPTEIMMQKLMVALVHGTKPAQALAVGPPGRFFSGGSARAVIACGLLAYFLGWLGLTRRQRALLWTCVALSAFIEGYSRLYLGRHWAIDIAGGWLAGALVAAAFIFAAGALRSAAAIAPVASAATSLSAAPGAGAAAAPDGTSARQAGSETMARAASGRGNARPARWHSARPLAIVLASLGFFAATIAAVAGPWSRTQPAAPSATAGSLAPAHGALFGAWVQPNAGFGPGAEEAAIAGLERALGRKLAIAQVYVGWAAPMPLTVARWDLSGGRVPLISWGGTRTDLIAAGAYDAQIHARALQLRALGGPVMLRWFWEMDGPYNRQKAVSTASFIKAWRHIHDIFTNARARNVRWVWCPNANDFRTGYAQRFYPGDRYVDWICADGYSWAPGQPGALWRSFGQIFSDFYRWARETGKPLLVGEFGVLERRPGEKAAWLVQADWQLQTRFPRIRAVVYFDSHHRRLFDWKVTTSASAFAAFRAFSRDPYFSARPRI